MASDNSEQVDGNTCKSTECARNTTWMERLPREVYLDIVARLPISSLLECKLVSRLWNASVKDPVLNNMQLTHAVEKHHPYLIIFSDWPKPRLQLADINAAVDGGFMETVKVLKVPFESVLPDFEVVGSCNGLVCLYNFIRDDPLYVYNPFTVEFRELPKLCTHSQSNVCRVVFGFGSNPRTRDYKAIEIIYYKTGNNDFYGDNPEAFVLSLSNPTWRNIGNTPYHLTGPSSDAEVMGKLHWMTHYIKVGEVTYRDIVSFDMETEEFSTVPQPDCEGLNQTDYHIVTLKCCLSAVFQCSNGSTEIWVMKDYNVKESWTKEYIIGVYVPGGFRVDMAPPARRKKNGSKGRRFRVLCCLKNGEILFLYRGRRLGCYNPESDGFKDLNFEGFPVEFEACVHVGSLVSVDTIPPTS